MSIILRIANMLPGPGSLSYFDRRPKARRRIRPESLTLHSWSVKHEHKVDGTIIGQRQESGTIIVTVDTEAASKIFVRQLTSHTKIGRSVFATGRRRDLLRSDCRENTA